MTSLRQDDIMPSQNADQIEIIYYTDPLCCWSWAFEPQWRKLCYEFRNKISYRYVMGGLIADWNSYHDPFNSVSRPLQMGPVWMQASQVSGMCIKDTIWLNDPPRSSYPACIAVKCAALQSTEASEAYLRCLRESVMLDGKNISKYEVLIQLAKKLSEEAPEFFSVKRFEEDLGQEEGRKSFQHDLEEARYYSISRFPTLTIKKAKEPGVMIVGYRPYNVLLEAIKKVDPDLLPDQKITDEISYKNYWGDLTKREIEEAVMNKEL